MSFDPRDYPLRASQLCEMRHGADHYFESMRKRCLGDDDTTSALELGSAVHGLAFNTVKVIRVDCATRAAKEYKSAAAENPGAIVLPAAEHEKAINMVASLVANQAFANAVRDPLATLETQIKWEWDGRACLSTPDMICGGTIYDLKTTRQTLGEFFGPQGDLYRLRYLEKMAFYRRAVRASLGFDADIAIVAVENSAPYSCDVVKIPRELIDVADKRICDWFKRILFCEGNQLWRHADVVVTAPKWWVEEAA